MAELIPGQAVLNAGRKGRAGGGWASTKYAKRCEAPGCPVGVFVPVYENARFCSSACRQRAYRQRRAAAAKP